MSHQKKGIRYNGTTITLEDDVNFEGSIKIPYSTETGQGYIRYNTSLGKLEYFSHISGTWVQAGGAGLYYQEAGTANTMKQTNIFGVLYNLDSTWYFGTSITTPLSFYEAEGT